MYGKLFNLYFIYVNKNPADRAGQENQTFNYGSYQSNQ